MRAKCTICLHFFQTSSGAGVKCGGHLKHCMHVGCFGMMASRLGSPLCPLCKTEVECMSCGAAMTKALCVKCLLSPPSSSYEVVEGSPKGGREDGVMGLLMPHVVLAIIFLWITCCMREAEDDDDMMMMRCGKFMMSVWMPLCNGFAALERLVSYYKRYIVEKNYQRFLVFSLQVTDAMHAVMRACSILILGLHVLIFIQ